MEEGSQNQHNFIDQSDNQPDNENPRQDFQQAYSYQQMPMIHPHIMDHHQSVTNNYFPNQFFGQNISDPQSQNNSGPNHQDSQYFAIQQNPQILNQMSQYQTYGDRVNQQALHQQQHWVQINQSSMSGQQSDINNQNQLMSDNNIYSHLSSQMSDKYPIVNEHQNQTADFSLTMHDQNYQTPTKQLKPSLQDSLTQIRDTGQAVMSSEIINIRKQQQASNLAQQVLVNQKIPQSAQMNKRKIQNNNTMQQNIVYQEGNHDFESVNNLTDIIEPSNETNSVVEKNIINEILNEREDQLSYASDKNNLTQQRGDSMEKDNNPPLIQQISKGPNSVNNQGINVPRDFSIFTGHQQSSFEVQQQFFVPNTQPPISHYDQQNYQIGYLQMQQQESTKSQNLSGKISNENYINQFGGGKQFITPDYNADLLQQNQEFNINKLHQMNQGQQYYAYQKRGELSNNNRPTQNNQNLQQNAFQQQYPYQRQMMYNGFQNQQQIYGQTQMITNQMQQMSLMDQHDQMPIMNQMRQHQKPMAFGAMVNSQRSQKHSMNDNYAQNINGLSDINISDDLDLDKNNQFKFMSEKNLKTQADVKSDNREEKKLDLFKNKNNSYSNSRLFQVWQGANSQQNYRKSKEVESLPVSLDGVDDECQEIYFKKGNSQQSSFGSRQINRQPNIDENSQTESNDKYTMQADFHSNDFVGSGSGGAVSGNQRGSHGPSKQTTVTNYSNHGSRESYDEFIQQIQHEIKKANEDPDKEYEILEGNILKLAQKKVGSLFLQEHLKKAQQSLINKIISEIDGHIAELMMDNYGNYFCSQLIQYLQPHQRIHFLTQIKGEKFIKISCNSKGTHTLQNIIHAVTEKEEFQLIKDTLMLNHNIVRLAKDKMGQHMVQMIISSFKEDSRQYIFNEILENFEELATDKQGLCVMKKLIEKTANSQSQIKIVQKILEKVCMYVQNEFGNFVVSEALQHFSYEICSGIYTKIEGNFVKLSQNKYSSKFIENCIYHAPQDLQKKIIKEFVGSDQLSKVVESNFGNFVLQHTLNDFSKCQQTSFDLIESITDCLLNVKEYKVRKVWGSQILVKHLVDTKNHRVKEILNKLDKVMNESENLNKAQKHQQTQKMTKIKNHERDSNQIKKQSSGGGSNSSGNGGYYSRQNHREYDQYDYDNQYGGYRNQPQSGIAQYNFYEGETQKKGNKNIKGKNIKYVKGKGGEKIIIDKNSIKFAQDKNF